MEVIDSIGDVLYGRDEEMRFLERKFAGLGQKSIENEAIEVCLISGAAGTGKVSPWHTRQLVLTRCVLHRPHLGGL